MMRQVTLKKGQIKRGGQWHLENFTIKVKLAAVTSADRPERHWLQELRDVDQITKKKFMLRGLPDIPDNLQWLMSAEGVKAKFIERLHAGEITPEFIGRHGIPGLAWPPSEAFDEVYRHVFSASHIMYYTYTSSRYTSSRYYRLFLPAIHSRISRRECRVH